MPKAEKPYVLVVDDNEATCTLITALLQRDFQIDVATDGGEAIEKLRTKQYAAILLDLRMPQYDGYAVLDFLEQNNPDAISTVLIVTAALSPSDLSRVENYKVCGIVPKPFEVETLLNAVKECIGGVFCTPVILLLAEVLQRRWM